MEITRIKEKKSLHTFKDSTSRYLCQRYKIFDEMEHFCTKKAEQ